MYTDSKSAETIKAIRAEYGLLDKTVIVATDNLFELEGDLLARMEKASRNQDFLDFDIRRKHHRIIQNMITCG